jgi:NAD(P)-dependent dehydrogenase (short-subunit alcohol dehydrogenase family)
MRIKDLFNLTGRVAVVTGGAGLLGKQHASALAEAGCKVILWDIEATSLKAASDKLSAEFPDQIWSHVVDISDVGTIKAATDELSKAFGGINILINNASMTVARGQDKFQKYFEPFESYPTDLWEMALKVNLTGTVHVTQALYPLLKKRAGQATIINIASDVGVISPDHRIYEPNPEHGYEGVKFNSPLSYAVSKASLIHMTKYWATYWAKQGIRVNALSPAGVANSQDEKFVRELVERIPMGRMAQPHEYKGAILFLASDASSFMTGGNLIIDGGRTAW